MASLEAFEAMLKEEGLEFRYNDLETSGRYDIVTGIEDYRICLSIYMIFDAPVDYLKSFIQQQFIEIRKEIAAKRRESLPRLSYEYSGQLVPTSDDVHYARLINCSLLNTTGMHVNEIFKTILLELDNIYKQRVFVYQREGEDYEFNIMMLESLYSELDRAYRTQVQIEPRLVAGQMVFFEEPVHNFVDLKHKGVTLFGRRAEIVPVIDSGHTVIIQVMEKVGV